MKILRGAAVLAWLFLPSTALGQRLPTTVLPDHYDIAIAPDLAKAAFEGTVRIRVRLETPLTEIVLNAAEIEFDAVTVVAGGRTQTAQVSLDAATEQATFKVPEPIPAGPAHVDVKYRGILNGRSTCWPIPGPHRSARASRSPGSSATRSRTSGSATSSGRVGVMTCAETSTHVD
jgi:hypothetical protein